MALVIWRIDIYAVPARREADIGLDAIGKGAGWEAGFLACVAGLPEDGLVGLDAGVVGAAEGVAG